MKCQSQINEYTVRNMKYTVCIVPSISTKDSNNASIIVEPKLPNTTYIVYAFIHTVTADYRISLQLQNVLCSEINPKLSIFEYE